MSLDEYLKKAAEETEKKAAISIEKGFRNKYTYSALVNGYTISNVQCKCDRNNMKWTLDATLKFNSNLEEHPDAREKIEKAIPGEWKYVNGKHTEIVAVNKTYAGNNDVNRL